MMFGSLFSGIGGFDLGFERAGMKCAWQCEIDPKASAVLARHWPGVPNIGDVRNVRRDNVETVDVICGGFPCQDLSVAGKRAGLAGERSGLWFEFARVIDKLEPGWVVIENVPGLLSSNRGRDFAIILQWLAKRGYGVAWRVLDAQYFGLAQRRKRVFIVASFGCGRCAEILFEREGGAGDTPPQREAGKVAPTLFASGAGTSRTAAAGSEADFCIPVEAETTPTMRAGGDSHSGFVNVGGLCVVAHGQANAEIVRDGEPSLTAAHEVPIVAPILDAGYFTKRYSDQHFFSQNGDGYPIAYKIRGGKEGGGKGFLGSEKTPFSLTGFNDQYLGVRRLTPVECERLQGFPDGWTDGQADTARYKQLGNAVAVPCAEWIARRIQSV